jgi:hypothetical protein
MHNNTIRHSQAKLNAPRNTQLARPNQVPVILISENESMQTRVIARSDLQGCTSTCFCHRFNLNSGRLREALKSC